MREPRTVACATQVGGRGADQLLRALVDGEPLLLHGLIELLLALAGWCARESTTSTRSHTATKSQGAKLTEWALSDSGGGSAARGVPHLAYIPTKQRPDSGC